MKFKVQKVILLPFGGLTVLDEKINHSLNKELLVVLMGPIFQVGLSFFIKDIEIINIHKAILYFNLLPIYPLDGSKIINICFNKILSFKFSQKLTIFLSFLTLTVIIIMGINNHLSLMFILILVFLLKKVLEEKQNIYNLFNKFLLERYLYQFDYKRTKKINRIDQMQLNKKHLIRNGYKWSTEKEFLTKMFKKQGC